ncbi:Pro-kumamolisin [Phlyctema vagabunda]|uniref:tripeptidyl-peptidase II n=1 Tax=Phlyctema vagabunda TaxID=108571 RepID=A0ABR4PBK2_9HELO
MISLRLALKAIAFSALLHGASAANAFESLTEVPRGWKFVRAADSSEAIKLRLSLKQQNVENFYQSLLDVSTPEHERYGQHYEAHELRDLLKPTERTSTTVTNWLKSSNITAIQDDSDWILFRTTVGNANKLLDTEFGWYLNEEANQKVLRTLAYSVPESVKEHINFVQPTTRFGSLKKMGSDAQRINADSTIAGWFGQSTTAVDAACNTTITPQCLLQLYNIHYKGSPDNGNTVGYASFLEEYARYDDLALFEAKYAPYAVGENFTVVQFNGGLNDQNSTDDSGEANLDQQYVLGVGYDTPITEFSTGGRGLLIPDGDSPTQDDNTNEPYLDWLLALTKLPNKQIPNSISVSYGENEQEIPVSYAQQVCQLFGQLGARGKTIIFSSGDSGTGDFCLSNDGKNTTKFQPQFPASCPYVTSVGGTRYIEPEQAVFFSSGGFSNIWPRPLYQELAISSYLSKLGKKQAGLFNSKGRGFPDVAAQGQNFRVFNSGKDVGYRGTSCSAPAFNGVVALLNSARISAGLPTLGFLNPWLYTVGQFGLNDITVGGSTGCNGLSRFNISPNGSPVIPYASWNATAGWDPVTGLGTPDFGKLLKLSTPFAKNTGGVLP